MKYHIIILSTYPRRQCGIASFTRDTVRALKDPKNRPYVESIEALAIDNEGRKYGKDVSRVINQADPNSWLEAADYVTKKAAEWKEPTVVLSEWEYGIDTSPTGDSFSQFNKRIKNANAGEQIIQLHWKHTVLKTPNEHQLKVANEMAEYTDAGIVTTRSSVDTSTNPPYECDPEKIKPIHHGVHILDPKKKDRLAVKRELSQEGPHGLEDKFLVLTPGMPSPGKGIEDSIKAFARFRNTSLKHNQHEAVYIVLGKPHPVYEKEKNGEPCSAYLQGLYDLSLEEKLRPEILTQPEQLKEISMLDTDIVFLRYTPSDKKLLEFFCAANTIALFYKNLQQSSSGIFAWSIGAGRIPVTTKYPHACDIINPRGHKEGGLIFDEHSLGVLVNGERPTQGAAAFDLLAFNRDLRNAVEAKELDFASRNMHWPDVSDDILRLAHSVWLKKARQVGRGIELRRERTAPPYALKRRKKPLLRRHLK